MVKILELSDQKFEIILMSKLRMTMEKIGPIQDQAHGVSRDMENVKESNTDRSEDVPHRLTGRVGQARLSKLEDVSIEISQLKSQEKRGKSRRISAHYGWLQNV